ncbi:MAG: CBS domain-containing protein [Chlorobium sp.]|nr:MAG: CBS domain-containing protein [Chlorobium sp.]
MLLTEFIKSALDQTCPFFADDMTVVEVIDLMQKGRLECAPVLQEGKITAMVTLRDLLLLRPSSSMNELCLRDLELEKTGTAGLHEHLFEVCSRMRSFPAAIVPVLEEDGRYAGIIEKAKLLEKIGEVFHLGEEGSTIELDVPSFGLKLSEIIATLEKNDATVLSFGLYHEPSKPEGMVVTFRVQTHDLFRLVKNIENYGYSVRYSSPFFREGDEELREKALEFIHFLDM